MHYIKLSNNFQTFFIFSSVDEPTIIEDLDAEVQVKPRPESRATPLKSLLKKKVKFRVLSFDLAPKQSILLLMGDGNTDRK